MTSKYSSLWNQNYRTCSLIASKLCLDLGSDFLKLVQFVRKNKQDGYEISNNNSSFYYYGSSSILLSLICKIYNGSGIWDKYLNLVPLNTTEVAREKNVSLSRLILTYIYNTNGTVQLKTLYDEFCKNGLFSYKDMCDVLSKLLSRNPCGVWRRAIYYAKEVILSQNSDEICNKLMNECQKIQNFESSNIEFAICDAGISYVERLMQEFEFYSNRISNEHRSLYLYDTIDEISDILNKVYFSVFHCVKNMKDFKKRYIASKAKQNTEIEVNKVDDYYNTRLIHPNTKKGFSQLHTERVIFSHIAYLNNVRIYFISLKEDDSIKREYNRLFVNAIKRYLELYETEIVPLSSNRKIVADLLINIIKEIETEEKNIKPNDEILFKSISL